MLPSYILYPLLKLSDIEKHRLVKEIQKSSKLKLCNMPSLIDADYSKTNEDSIIAFLESRNFGLLALSGKSRQAKIISYRFVFYYLMRKYTSHPFDAIGDMIGRHHSSVIHGVNECKYQIESRRGDFYNIIKEFESIYTLTKV